MTLISVIIPVYNVEKFLGQCLNSVTNQTFRDLQIICIDDGSTDSSGKILDEYAARDSRFVVIHGPNGFGPSRARNTGLRLAEGEYTIFVDSDDWIEPDLCEKTLAAIQESGLEMVCFPTWCHNPTRTFVNYHLSSERKILSDFWEKIRFGEKCGQVIYNRIYRTDFLKKNQIVFIERVAYEDSAFSLETLVKSRNILVLNTPFYHYRQSNGYSLNPKAIIFRMTVVDLYVQMIARYTAIPLPLDFMVWLYAKKYRAYSHFYRRIVSPEYKAEFRNRILAAISEEEWLKIERREIPVSLKTRCLLYWLKGGVRKVLSICWGR